MFNYKEIDPGACEFVAVAETGDIRDGERMFVDIDELSIVVFNIAGQFFAIGDVCSHDDGPVGEGDLQGYEVICPRHGARFDIRSGKVLSLPAFVDIPAYPVKVIEGQITVGVPIEQ